MDVPNKVAFVWHHNDALPARLAATGHDGALIKGGVDGDQPVLWTDVAGRPSWATINWTPAICQAYKAAGVEPLLFIYTTFGRQYGMQGEIDGITRLCQIFLPERICLNFEVETDNMPDSTVNQYFDQLTAALAQFGDNRPALDNSSVPSWNGSDGSRYHDVPYKAVSGRTEIDFFQDYWKPWSWEDGFEQRYLVPGPNKRVFPIAPAWAPDFSAADLDSFGAWAAGRGYQGVATWEAGNANYLWQGVNLLFQHFGNPPAEVFALPGQTGDPEAWHCDVTDKWVLGPFKHYYEAHDDAVARFGYPVTGEFLDENGLHVQYFERARFERQADGSITLGRVGAELAQAKGIPGTF
jgi:hypothetical protein